LIAILSLKWFMDHLNDGGRAGVVVPTGVLSSVLGKNGPVAFDRPRPPRCGFAGRFLPTPPTTAAVAQDGALASAPSDGRVGETPVASDGLNIRPVRPWINISGFKSAPVSTGAPVHGRAPSRAGKRASSNAVTDFAAGV